VSQTTGAASGQPRRAGLRSASPVRQGGASAWQGGAPARQGGADVASARTAFLVDDPVRPDSVRGPILASWTRSRLWHVRPDNVDLPSGPEQDGTSALVQAAEPVLRQIADLFATEPVSVILCDTDGFVLSRRTGDSSLEQHLDRVWLAPGFSYAEQFVGTNGIGTALEARGPAHVFGHEHYVDRLADLACAGAPIRHPVTGKLLGVVDLTCWQRDSGPLLVAMAGTLTRRIEDMLFTRSEQRELAVLHDYLIACRRNRGPVLAVGDDLLMMNDSARELLDPADQEPLLAEASEALAEGRRHPLVIDLPSRRAVRVHCHPTYGERGIVGGVLQVQLISPIPAQRSRSSVGSPVRSPVRLPAAVGSGAAWTQCCAAVDRHVQAREWLVLEGEPGSGRETVARAAHHARMPAARLRVMAADGADREWVAEVAEELEVSGGTLVLTDVDRLPPDLLAEVADVLEPYRESPDADRRYVLATVARPDPDPAPELIQLLSCFPRTVAVPPLRHHVEDVAELVPHLLARLGHGSTVTCSPESMRVLTHHRWPGNVDQLVGVLRKVLATRRSGTIGVRDLPPECLSTTRRMLTPLESLECDAIVQALLDSSGNKVEAARSLAMSRATIYRKIRDFGISVSAVEPRP
jgi:sigma-54 dependent transcriptional regulator, acetoin dehydrogenase operon transcriptional activator AcoR